MEGLFLYLFMFFDPFAREMGCFSTNFAHNWQGSAISGKIEPDFFGYKINPRNFAVPKSKGSECLLYNNW
jgi:hypothetical protein